MVVQIDNVLAGNGTTELKRLAYSKSVLVNYGPIAKLTAGCGGSGSDSGGQNNGAIAPNPVDGSCGSV